MWFLHSETSAMLDEIRRSGAAPSAEQIEAFEARDAQTSGAPTVRNGRTTVINVHGVLTKQVDVFMALFGGGSASYEAIESALREAQSDPSVDAVVLDIASPGGAVDGLFEVLAAIETFRDSGKALSVRASRALSAAYAIAAMAGNVSAKSAASEFGSVGVAVDYWVRGGVVSLTNSGSPDKRPDVTTEEGRAVVVRHLDAVNELFVDAIARGRGMSVGDVAANFGRGAVLLAGEAQRRGMIDSIARPALVPVRGGAAAQATTPVASTEKSIMTMDELRAQHPHLVAALISEGEAKERDRVSAHLTLGKQAGAMDIAITAIEEGTGMTMALQAKYLAAGMNRSDVQTRQRESDEASAVVDGADAKSKGEEKAVDIGDLVVARLKGLSPKAGE